MAVFDTLSIDTCGASLLLVFSSADGDFECHHEPMVTGHAEAIVPALEHMRRRFGASFDGPLKRVGVTTGPGSFTGLRVGLAVAKARAVSDGCKVVGANRLRMLARCVQITQGVARPVHVAVDARRGEHFVQAFDERLSPLTEPYTLANDQVEDWCASQLAERPGSLTVSIPEDIPGGAMAKALLQEVQHGETVSHRTIVPLYVRPPDAKKPKGSRFTVQTSV